MSDSGIGQGADSFFQDSDESGQDTQDSQNVDPDKQPGENSGKSNDDAQTAARERKQVAMYLPGDAAEDLRRGWHHYAADHPDATKNDDYFPDVIEAGLEALDLK